MSKQVKTKHSGTNTFAAYVRTFQAFSSRDRQTVKIAANTVLRREEDGSIAVVYHYTPIVTYKPDGKVIVQHGGYMTTSTKDRINQFSPFGVSQRKGDWFFNDGSHFPFNGEERDNPLEPQGDK